MIPGMCPYTCNIRTDNGFCAVTACVNPLHNGSGTYILGENGMEKYNPGEEGKGSTTTGKPEDCVSETQRKDRS